MFNRKGFTILELLIVITVIAILVGIALPRFKGMRDEGNIAKAKGELRTLQTAVESFRIHSSTNVYPATSAGVCAASLNGAVPQIVATPLYDPFGATATTEYNYKLATDGIYYVIYSAGAGATAGVCAITGTGGTVSTTTGNPVWVSNGSPQSGG